MDFVTGSEALQAEFVKADGEYDGVLFRKSCGKVGRKRQKRLSFGCHHHLGEIFISGPERVKMP